MEEKVSFCFVFFFLFICFCMFITVIFLFGGSFRQCVIFHFKSNQQKTIKSQKYMKIKETKK